MKKFAIRKLEESDWQIFRNIRLEALQKHPELFNPSNNEFLRSEQEWKDVLKSITTFGLFEKDKIIGITGIVTDRDDPSGKTGLFVMSYIQPQFRKQDLSQLLYSARIDWAKNHSNYKKLKVGHREGNEASRKANQKFGFVLKSKDLIEWPDSKKDLLYTYELNI